MTRTGMGMLAAIVMLLLGAGMARGAGAPGAPAEYRLKTGDTIAITVWDCPEHTVPRVEIRPDGKVVHPFAGEVQAAGRTAAQVAAEIRKALLKEVRDPLVTVTVVDFREERLFVTGAVARPGPVPVREPLTVQQAVAAAGGPLEVADRRRGLVIRPDGSPQEIDLEKELKGGSGAAGLLLGAGYTLVLYERAPEKVAVLGAVNRPGIFDIPPEGRIADALALAGGLGPDADPEAGRFTRAGAETLSVDLQRILDNVNDPANLLLRPGDAILVPVRRVPKVAVLGAVIKPGTYEITPGARVANAVALAGGPAQDADLRAVRLTRRGAEVVVVDLKRVLDDVNDVGNLLLEEGDGIFVPSRERATVAILGAVNKPGVYDIPPGARLTEVLVLAAGFAPEADLSAGRFTRADAGTLIVDLQRLMDNPSEPANVPVKNGDAVFVPVRPPVAVLGAVQRPGMIQLPPGAHLATAIAQAGGLREDADSENVRLTRAGSEALTLNLRRVLENANDPDNVPLKDGDAILVPSRDATTAAVLGSVNRPGVFSIPPGGRLGDLVALAGGFTTDADPRAARFARNGAETVTVDLQRLLDDVNSEANLPLQHGDALFVPARELVRVSVLGAVNKPGVYEVPPQGRVADAIALAGGLATDADRRNARFARVDQPTVAVDLEKLLDNPNDAANVVLQHMDAILVPQRRPATVAVLGEVVLPGVKPLEEDATVSAALALAGGPTKLADQRSARLMRADGATVALDLERILGGSAPEADLRLSPGDILFVPELKLLRVVVLGAVKTPAQYLMQPRERFSDALARAGGLLDAVDRSLATVTRSDGRTQDVDLRRILEARDPEANLELADGDLIVVTSLAQGYAAVLGAVAKPGRYKLVEARRLADLVAMGGLLEVADSTAQLLRADGNTVEVDLNKVVSDNRGEANLELRDGDTLVVSSAVRNVAVLGAVKLPGRYSLRKNHRFSDAVASAGDLTEQADRSRARLLRVSGETLDVNPDEALSSADPQKNPLLEDGDTIIVEVAPPREVSVLGRVNMPRRVPLSTGDRVSDAIVKAGGLAPGAEERTATIMRADGTVLQVDLEGVLRRKDARANIPLEPGDTLVVDASSPGHAGVIGAVTQPGFFPFERNERISDLLVRAGGPTPQADLAHCTLRRADGTRMDVDLAAILANVDAGANVALMDGDTLNVPSLNVGEVAVLGAVRTPSRYSVGRGERVSALIARAGGLADPAVTEALLMRSDGTAVTVNVSAALAGAGSADDPPVGDGDTLVVHEAAPVTVLGAVKNQGVVRLAAGAKASAAIAQAQGPLPNADLQNALIMHRNGTTTPVDLAKVLNAGDHAADVALQPGDVLVVPAAANVSVIGAVVSPGQYPIMSGARLTEVIALARGLTETADLEKCTVMRGSQMIPVDLAKVMRDRDSAANIVLRDGDTVIVDQIRPVQVSVLGKVTREGRYALTTGARLSQAIAQAGGLLPEADAERVSVMSTAGARVVDLTPLLAGQPLADDVALADGDTVVVPETPHNVTVLGVVGKPGSFTFRPGERVLDVVARAGGWVQGAAPHRALLTRRAGDKVAVGTLNLVAATRGGNERQNPELQDGDLIYMPSVSQGTLDNILKALYPVSTVLNIIY